MLTRTSCSNVAVTKISIFAPCATLMVIFTPISSAMRTPLISPSKCFKVVPRFAFTWSSSAVTRPGFPPANGMILFMFVFGCNEIPAPKSLDKDCSNSSKDSVCIAASAIRSTTSFANPLSTACCSISSSNSPRSVSSKSSFPSTFSVRYTSIAI